MVARSWVPDSGDVVWLNFDPRVGHEQSGRRPALVVTPASYNKKSSLAIVCPITSRVKGYPFQVGLPKGASVAGVVLAGQLKSVDWQERRGESLGKVSDEVMMEIPDRSGRCWGSDRLPALRI